MYGVKLDDVLINGKSTNVCADRECLITFDSGTSEMSIPKFAEKILAAQGIPTSDIIQPCNDAKSFGELTFVIGGQHYTMANDDWMLHEHPLDMLAQGALTN